MSMCSKNVSESLLKCLEDDDTFHLLRIVLTSRIEVKRGRRSQKVPACCNMVEEDPMDDIVPVAEPAAPLCTRNNTPAEKRSTLTTPTY